MRPDLPPVSRFFMGVGGFVTRLPKLFGVLAVSLVISAALYTLWLVLDPSAGGEARFALAPLILSQQVFVFLRCLLKVGYYAAVAEALTRTQSPEYAYASASAAASTDEPAAASEPAGEEATLDGTS